MSILKFDHLSKRLQGSSENQPLFSNVSAVIDEPERIALLAPSGQGKSTLLRILSLLDCADEGDILLNNVSFREWQPLHWRMKAMYVAQQAVMLPGSVEDNLRIASRLHRTVFDNDYARKLMADVGLHELDWCKPSADLSGGEKQRVALVRSLLLYPDLLLLDEITASLDPHSKVAVEVMLAELHEKQGTTYIWVTHDLEQARSVSNRVWFMGEGTLLEDAPTGEFFRSPQSEAARRFLSLADREEGEKCQA
ncbi:ATP-binding cassette domain-containing protein [Paenibacillus oenotherae]|uniref:ATP-binding cassette domain-containing protein n=1 Tax=Paenibacillus oenotherae TaxID=1435645 RepID=A0ABS7DBL1_9BACL|nr:ATP-binding cassette domain-containing protein [Paenibacillus oenotherae]MBW7477133.1 ATP-binding cassette domain-containing protein [Paenibacillus oenotherae]